MRVDKNVKYKRTGSVLNKKYMYFMLPAMFSAVGISLSEFADSMVVSHLLSSEAFAVINVGIPIVFAVSLIYTIMGIGGSLLFAECLGRKDKKKANQYFTLSTVLSLLLGILLFVLLMFFHPILGELFGCPEELRPQFNSYTRVLSFFVPIAIFLMHITYFLPIVGKPILSMGIILSTNVLNIILDFVFIRKLGMNCEGAALATLVSYIVVALVMLLIWHFGNIPLTLCEIRNTKQGVKEIVKKGAPSGSVQAGYLVTTIFCNYFMNLAFGLKGVVAMSLFAQLDSFISIALTGIVDNNASFAAMLKGEGDYYGIRSLSKRVTVIIVLVCTVLSIIFVMFYRGVAAIFNIHEPEMLELIGNLIPIYVLYYPLRSILLVLRDIYNTLDRSIYATALGILDKVVSIPLIGGVLYLFFGGYGLISSFPLSMLLILCLIVVINQRIVKKSKGRYSPVLLLDEEYRLKALCSYSVKSLDNASEIGQWIGKSLVDTYLEPSISDKICLAAEEMGVYIIDRCGTDTAVDFLVATNGSEFILTCRSSGEPFYPIKIGESELSPNELLLTRLFNIKYEYIFGLNSVSLTIGAQKNEK
ncbi:MAG TPA: hypothetical protein DCG28_03285 [Lachnospiraceae bacterium]|nr:hypothetical protein [Lachnospiraceae bacterium]